ncbi:MAG: hypothetical protein GWN00_31695, partial [Aliifodinibius sp.]|nr:hypothetical protein [Fodinibius sp.]NIV15324.1 hypothetical protein [Fodinibius sp.]NIY29187.1 hypothetical protein [Fodinibius sp.]
MKQIPRPYILPSLNQQGEPVYRLGLLSTGKPLPLMLTASSDEGTRRFKVSLVNSDFDHYSDEVFREDIIGGIPVVRVRGFGDSDPDDLTNFVQTGRNLRGEPVIIVDIRGNRGGNERWPSRWIQGLTGIYPDSIFVFSELESKTSLIGRANAFAYWGHQGSNPSLYKSDVNSYTRSAE